MKSESIFIDVLNFARIVSSAVSAHQKKASERNPDSNSSPVQPRSCCKSLCQNDHVVYLISIESHA